MVKKDHCTAAPDFHFGATCCKAHDDAYSAGIDRAQADADLLVCIAASGAPWRGILYFMGVRLGGWLFWRRKAARRRKAAAQEAAA